MFMFFFNTTYIRCSNIRSTRNVRLLLFIIFYKCFLVEHLVQYPTMLIVRAISYTYLIEALSNHKKGFNFKSLARRCFVATDTN